MDRETQTSAPLPEPDAEWRQMVERRLRLGDRSFREVRRELAAQKLEIAENTKITTEGRDIILMGKSFFSAMEKTGRVLSWCGRALYKLVTIGGTLATAVAALWAAGHWLATGKLPPKP